MKLLLDEMYSGLKEHFQVLGWDVETLHDAGLVGSKDIEVVDYVKRKGLLLITQDQKHGELAELLGVKYLLISNALIAKAADDKIKEKYPEQVNSENLRNSRI